MVAASSGEQRTKRDVRSGMGDTIWYHHLDSIAKGMQHHKSSDMDTRVGSPGYTNGVHDMIAPFDIFKAESEGKVRWIGSAVDLETAKKRAQVVGQSDPGEYVILSQITGNRLSVIIPNPNAQKSALPPDSQS